MSTPSIYVADEVERVVLLRLIAEIRDGFWRDYRPVGHAARWEGVEVVVSADRRGPVGFEPARLYNFVNPEFLAVALDDLVAMVQEVEPGADRRRVKWALIQLSRNVGGRLPRSILQSGPPRRADRGQPV